MGKVAIFTDLHAHPFRAYAQVLPGGMNSRLADAISCIDQVRVACAEREVDLVLFGGDMFHVRKNIPVQAFNAVYDAMAKFADAKLPVLAIHGNHDQADRLGTDHSIYALRSFLTVVDQPGWVSLQGRSGQAYAVLAIPYTEDLEHLRKVVGTPMIDKRHPRILLGHLGIQGAKVGADFVYVNAADPAVTDLGMQNYDAGFLGHYHMHQQVADKLWYVGAPLQHNWGDRGQTRGFMIYDTATGEADHYPLRAPRFEQVHEDDLGLPLRIEGCFVRIVTRREWSPEERDEFASAHNLLSLEFVHQDEETRTAAPRLVVEPGMARQDVLRAYVESGLGPVGDLDEEFLLKVGAEILQEVGEG